MNARDFILGSFQIHNSYNINKNTIDIFNSVCIENFGKTFVN